MGQGGGGGGVLRIRFSSGGWIIGSGKTGEVLQAGCGLGVCGQTVAPPPSILEHNPPPLPASCSLMRGCCFLVRQ